MSDNKAYNDWLDDLLRQEADYVSDDGFTARVLAALPETRRRWYASRSVILLAATMFASVAALLIPGLAGYVVGSLIDIVTLKSVSAGKLAVLVPIALFYWAGLSAAAAER
jgi:hypothetical protein